MNRRNFIVRAATALAGLFGVNGITRADIDNFNSGNKRLKVLEAELSKATEIFGDDWPPVWIDADDRPSGLIFDIVDPDGESVPNCVVAINEYEGWISMYPLESAGDGLVGYDPIVHYGSYRITGMTRAQRIAHNDRYGSPVKNEPSGARLAYFPQTEKSRPTKDFTPL